MTDVKPTPDFVDAMPLFSAVEANTLYRASRQNFRATAKQLRTISKGTGGLISTGNRMFWSSLLFTRLTVTAQSIITLTPKIEAKSHWDFSSLASLVRNFIECFFVLHFLCFDDVSDDERHARFLMMHMHDNYSRNKMLKNLGSDQGVELYEFHRHDLEKRIRETIYFNGLSAKRQQAILRADRTPFVQDDILDKLAYDRDRFRGLYRLLSEHTHTGPVSIYRMRDHGAGSGVENHRDKVYSTLALDLASHFAKLACEGIAEIFPNAETRGSKVPDSGIERHVARLQEAQSRGEIIEP